MYSMERLKRHAHTALRKSEKYFKTDMVYLAKGGFWLSIGQGVSSLSSFALAVAFANLLPKEAYGNYKYIIALAGILGLFTLTGMGQALTQAIARGFSGEFRLALFEKLKWGFAGSIASFMIAAYYLAHSNTLLGSSFIIVGILMPLTEAFSLYDAVLQGKKDFFTSTKYYCISQLVSLGMSLGALALTQSIPILIFMYFFSWTITRYIFTKIILEHVPNESPAEPNTLRYGKHLSVMGILNTIANYADRILLFQTAGATEAAIYSIAIAIPEQSKGLFKTISVVAFPKFSERSFSEIKKTIYSKLALAFAIVVSATILYIVIAPYFFRFIFPQYLESTLYSQIFALSLVSVISVIPIGILQAHKKTKELYIHTTATPLVQLLLMVICIPLWGVMGAIIARVAARFFSLILALILLIWTQENKKN